MLKEAHAEKSRLMESRVRRIWTRSPRRGGGVPASPLPAQGQCFQPWHPHDPGKIPLRKRVEGQGALVRFMFTACRKRGAAQDPPSTAFLGGNSICVLTSVGAVATMGLLKKYIFY